MSRARARRRTSDAVTPSRCALCYLLLASGGCAPSRAELFEPVLAAVQERAALAPEWREGKTRTAASERKVRQLLARPLTAKSTALIAVLSSAELQAEYSQLAAAGSEVSRAGAPANPELGAEITFPVRGSDAAHVELTALEDVSALLATIPRSSSADAELSAARRRAAAATLAIATEAERRFYEAVAAEQQLALRRSFADAASASGELARSLRAAGNVTELEALREVVFEEEAQLGLQQASLAASTSRQALSAVLGVETPQSDWKLPPELLPPPEQAPGAPELERVAVASSLELEALRFGLEAAGQGVGLARMESFLPHLGVGVALKREEEWRVGPAVSLSLPLLDFGAAKRDAAWARVRGLEQRYIAATLRTRTAARGAAERLASARERASRFETRVLPRRAELLAQALRQYNAMNLDAFQLLVLRREQLSAQERHIEAVRDYWVTQSEVELLRRGGLPREQFPAPAAGHDPAATDESSRGH